MLIKKCAKINSCRAFGWLSTHNYCLRKCRQFTPKPRLQILQLRTHNPKEGDFNE